MDKKNKTNNRLGDIVSSLFGNVSRKTVIFSVLAVIALTGIIIVGYVLGYMVSYTNGDIAIDLNEYQANQSQTSIIYAYDENGEIEEVSSGDVSVRLK